MKNQQAITAVEQDPKFDKTCKPIYNPKGCAIWGLTNFEAVAIFWLAI